MKILFCILFICAATVASDAKGKVIVRMRLGDYSEGIQSAFFPDGDGFIEKIHEVEGTIVLPEEHEGKTLRIRVWEKPDRSNLFSKKGSLVEFLLKVEDYKKAVVDYAVRQHYTLFVTELKNIRRIETEGSNNAVDSTSAVAPVESR